MKSVSYRYLIKLTFVGRSVGGVVGFELGEFVGLDVGCDEGKTQLFLNKRWNVMPNNNDSATHLRRCVRGWCCS